ncbi:MAG: ornithine cyclodeaminase family protein [Burkholderiales bacterium]|nr:ornithine cyclodeaminase family protein [Burkholderiales bacterium]
MLLVSEADVSRVLTMRDAVDCVERGLTDHARVRAIDVPRERTRSALGTLSILQGAAPQAGVTGYKAYYATPQGSKSHVYLYDSVSGAPLALIEANFFNVIRTGAASAVATRHLARADATVLGQIGAGRIGAGQLEGVCAVRSIRSARVYARTRDRLETFCAEMTVKLGIEVVPADTAADAVRGADVVNVITKSAAPVLAGAWLSPGQHVNAAGNNQLSRRELDTEAVRRCDLVIVDSRDTARRECGELLPLVESGHLRWEMLTEIGEIMSGLRPGRVADDQITLYKSHGMALQDLYVAARVLELVRAQGLGCSFAG